MREWLMVQLDRLLRRDRLSRDRLADVIDASRIA